MEYVAIQTEYVPTQQGEVIFAKNAPCSIMLVKGVLIINDRRGFFSITEQTRGTYFKLAPTNFGTKKNRKRTINAKNTGASNSASEEYRNRVQSLRRERLKSGVVKKRGFNDP